MGHVARRAGCTLRTHSRSDFGFEQVAHTRGFCRNVEWPSSTRDSTAPSAEIWMANPYSQTGIRRHERASM
jgi:hypothetical protein